MDSAVSYQDALRLASQQYYAGVQGQLWVPSSQFEVQSVIDLKKTFHNDIVWLGVSDATTESKWLATAGPYAGSDMSELIYWHNAEPGGGTSKNCAGINNDYRASTSSCTGTVMKYVVEFACPFGKRFNDQGTACIGEY